MTSITADSADQWEYINWQIVNKKVYEMQKSIAKSAIEGKISNILDTQKILTSSYPAKLLAVKIVTSSKGARTAGVDRERWNTPEKKIEAVHSLNQGHYRSKPARRINIPKPGSSEKRPISLLTMSDRAMQALYGLALRPVSETWGDPHSYGYRLNRSAPDAIRYLCEGISIPHSLPWILKGDIHQCFDMISHQWFYENIPIETSVLTEFLSCGYIEGWQFNHSEEGVMQGGYISPILANMALDGMESLLNKHFQADEFRFVRYADDLVVATAKKRIAEEIFDDLSAFIGERGLYFSRQKTDIKHLVKGFEYLGVLIRSSRHHLSSRPTDGSIRSILSSIQETISKGLLWSQEKMIKTLNPMISGWAYYHKYLPTSALDVRMNSAVQLMLRKWAEKRHPNQSAEWIAAEYWHPDGHVGKVFSSETTRLRSFSVKSLKRRDNYKETNPFLTNNEFFTLKTYKSDVSEKGQVNRFLYSSPILLLHGLKKSNFFF